MCVRVNATTIKTQKESLTPPPPKSPHAPVSPPQAPPAFPCSHLLKQRPTVCVLGHSAYGREVAVGGDYPPSSLFTAESFSTIRTHLLCVYPNIKRVLARVDTPGSSAPLVPWLRGGLVPAGAARRGQAGRPGAVGTVPRPFRARALSLIGAGSPVSPGSP